MDMQGRQCQVVNLFAVVVMLMVCAIGCTGSDVTPSRQALIDKIVSFVNAGMACHENPGLAIAIVKHGETVLTRGFGRKNLKSNEMVTDQSLFSIASLSKAFATTLMLKQIELDDTISLSTKVKDILADDNVFRDRLRSDYTTIEDLLAHRLGIRPNNNIRLDETLTRSNLVERIRHLKASYGFRTSFSYSNLMYGLATHISEKLGGNRKWEELVTEHLLNPLGMTSTTFVTTLDREKVDLVQGYQNEDGVLQPVPFEFSRHWGELCGSGCVVSNAVDMTKWMKFHLNGGKNGQNQSVVDKNVLASAYKPQNSITTSGSWGKYYTRPVTPVTFSGDNYGLGWRLGQYRGWPIVHHTGSTYGYRAMLTLVPSENLGVFIVMTGDDKDYMFRTNLQLYMLDLMLGETPWLDQSTLCSFPAPWAPKPDRTTVPPRSDIPAQRDLQAYVGKYANDAYGKLQIYFNDTMNRLMCIYGIATLELLPKTDADEFYAQGFGLMTHVRDYSTFRFVNGDDGVINELKVPSFDSKYPPIFLRVDESGTTTQAVNSARYRDICLSLQLLAVLLTVWCR